ncbi:hypothetical protein ACGFZL_08235 [Streptomyces sp. NPDC048182]|uniref:hypothetical protein n=1 Tax=Streptomyces sp. NPDC048182 TaxID=3365507 RepID=UPI003713C195
MSTPDTSRFVRVRVDLVLEIDDEEAVTGAALQALAEDPDLPDAERARAERAVTEDTAEALAHLVDPFDLVGAVPGAALQQASWSSERIDYDPDAPEWELGEDDDYDDDEGEGGGSRVDGEEMTAG